MNIDKDYVRDRIEEQFNWDYEDLRVLDAISDDLWSGPTYIVSKDSEHIENTVQVYDAKCGQRVPCYLGSWDAEGIIGDFFPVGIKHVQRMFEDVRSVYVNTDYDDVFFGSETKLVDRLFEFEKVCTSFEEWCEDYASDSSANDPDILMDEYENWIGRRVDYALSDWREFDLTNILELYVSKRTAREIAAYL